MSDRPGLLDRIAARPVVLDAGMGTRLIALGLSLSDDDPALWNLSRPEAVLSIHARDVDSGAEAVLTNTFGGNRAWLARFGQSTDVRAINRRAVALAREAAGPRRFVFGSIGPTALERPEACREQAELLLAEGVDALVLETFRADQADDALGQIGPDFAMPMLVSLHEWCEPAADAARRLEDLGAAVLGVNCTPGVGAALRVVERLAMATSLPLLVKPAGLEGEGPDAFTKAVPSLLALGARLVGGCCGTTDAHVAAIRAACYH